jgi:hypothetical protein|tara:strand:+ start:2236 stop:2649 length:414 start_codon:yes stop_codon:yes gene_type:complete
MKFKLAENNLIWENYGSNPQEQPQTSEFGEEEQEVVIEFEPEGPIEVDECGFDDVLDDVLEDGDDESEMSELVMTDIKKLDRNTKKLLDYCKSNKLEPWMQAKLVKAAVYVADVWDQLDDEADFANDGFEQSDNIDL